MKMLMKCDTEKERAQYSPLQNPALWLASMAMAAWLYLVPAQSLRQAEQAQL